MNDVVQHMIEFIENEEKNKKQEKNKTGLKPTIVKSILNELERYMKNDNKEY